MDNVQESGHCNNTFPIARMVRTVLLIMPLLRGATAGRILHIFSLLRSMDTHAFSDSFVVCLTTFRNSECHQRVVSFEVFMAVTMKSTVFWNMTPRSLVKIYRRF
jgi:hypothetical protein